MTKKCKWKKRLNLPYRLEYECKKGNELIGKEGIMALRDQFDIRDGKKIPKGVKLNSFGTAPLKTWKVIKRKYVGGKTPGQTYKDVKKNMTESQAKKYVRDFVKKK